MITMCLLLMILPIVKFKSRVWLCISGVLFSWIKCCDVDQVWRFIDSSKLATLIIALCWVILIIINLRAPPSLTLLSLISCLIFRLIKMFLVNNAVLFYLWFGFRLIPIAGIILGWGMQPERLSATAYILFYTILAAIPFIVVILRKTVFIFRILVLITSNRMVNIVLGWVIVLPFLVKTPIFLLHLWLPKAHVEAPVYGSIVLAGVLLKIGGIGIVRVVPLIPSTVTTLVGVISVWGGLIRRLICISQVDIKRLIAYSRVVHISITTTCILINYINIVGSVWIILIGHGLCSSGIFYLATVNYTRFITRRLVIGQGVLLTAPLIALCWVILIIINLRAPPSLTLLSEIMITYGCYILHINILIPIGVMIITVLIYRLQLYYNYFHES